MGSFGALISGGFKSAVSLFKDAAEFYKPPEIGSSERIILMRIDHFLAMAHRQVEIERWKYEGVVNAIRSGELLRDLPHLTFGVFADRTAKVSGPFDGLYDTSDYGHEGRHRAHVLASLGYTHMPVRFISLPDEFKATREERRTYFVSSGKRYPQTVKHLFGPDLQIVWSNPFDKKLWPKWLYKERDNYSNISSTRIRFPVRWEDAPLPAREEP